MHEWTVVHVGVGGDDDDDDDDDIGDLLVASFQQALEKLGIKKGPKSIQRSHIIVEKGGKVGEVQAGDGLSDRQ